MAYILQGEYFNAFSAPNSQNLKLTLSGEHGSTNILSEISFTRKDILNAINEQDPQSATAHENIPARVLKECKEALSVPLHLLWKWSFDNGEVPVNFKNQYITPIFKKGDKTKPSNYRPLALTPHEIKSFERVVRNFIVEHLEKNNLLDPNQHGFRKGRSCLTQLLKHYDSILQNYNSGAETDVLYLDFAKAFDKVDHNMLIAKLQIYGIQGKLLDWIRSFLRDRSQIVTVDGFHSVEKPVVSGIPQGSVLGPVLFIIYVNDLHYHIQNCKSSAFADDTKIQRKITTVGDMEIVKVEIQNATDWSIKNNMLLNDLKFVYLRYEIKKTNEMAALPYHPECTSYMLPSGRTLDSSPFTRDLGVLISADYTWDTHIGEMIQNAQNVASWVLSVFSDRSKDVMLQLLKSYVRTRLEFCSPLWSPVDIGNIQRIEEVQRSFVRRITGLLSENYWERLESLGLMSLQRRRERYAIIHIWKILRGYSPNDIEVQFFSSERRGVKVTIPKIPKSASCAAKRLFDNSFAVRGGQLWNLLPKDVTEADNLPSFKRLLGEFLDQIPDNPPVQGYSRQNSNSLIDWMKSGGLQEVWRPT